MNTYSQNDALSRLIRISNTIGDDQDLLNELTQEIKKDSSGPLCSMFKGIFKRKLINELGLFAEILNLLFQSQRILEYTLHDCSKVGIKCFFMPMGSSFPLHDHSNQAVCTGVLHGSIKYMSLERTEKNKCVLSKKGTAKVPEVLFLTKDCRNIHSILALEDSVIVDIFIPNEVDSHLSMFKVVKKRGREFKLEEVVLTKHSCCEHNRTS